MDSVQSIIVANKPCVTPELGGKVDPARGGRDPTALVAGAGGGPHFEPVSLEELRDLSAAADLASAKDGKRQKLCIVQSSDDAMKMENSFSSVHQVRVEPTKSTPPLQSNHS